MIIGAPQWAQTKVGRTGSTDSPALLVSASLEQLMEISDRKKQWVESMRWRLEHSEIYPHPTDDERSLFFKLQREELAANRDRAKRSVEYESWRSQHPEAFPQPSND